MTEILISKTDPHPHNRPVDTQSAKFLALVESLREHDQLEPALVRPVGKGRYQIIAGHRRRLALKQLKQKKIRCEIREVDDATALAEVAISNGQRDDLTPFDRAELLQQLTLPVEQGGSGMTKAEAGKIFGLSTPGSIRNAMLMSRVPEEFRELWTKHGLSELLLRQLVPYLHVPVLRERFLRDLTESWAGDTIGDLFVSGNRPGLPFFISEAIQDCLRPLSAIQVPVEGFGYRACQFRPNAEQLEKLAPFPLRYPLAGKSQSIEFTANVALFDELQLEACRKKAAAKTERAAKTDNKQSEAEARRRLLEFTAGWWVDLIRAGLTMPQPTIQVIHRVSPELAMLSLPWLISAVEPSTPLSDYVSAAYGELGIVRRSASLGTGDVDLLRAVEDHADTEPGDLLHAFWRSLIWPVSQSDKPLNRTLSPAGVLPERPPRLYEGDVLRIARLAKLGLSELWQSTAIPDSQPYLLLRKWLGRHTKAQLAALFNASERVSSDATMNQLIDQYMDRHTQRTRKPPAVIANRLKKKLAV